MIFSKKLIQKLIVILFLIMSKDALAQSGAGALHFKQLSDDGHTFILYSFRCASANKKKCSLQALAISDEKARNSCYVVYKTIFKDKPLKLKAEDHYYIEVNRDKCNDVGIYNFLPHRIQTEFKSKNLKTTPVNDERCEMFKATKNEGTFLSEQPTIPRIGFGDCKLFTFRMDD